MSSFKDSSDSIHKKHNNESTVILILLLFIYLYIRLKLALDVNFTEISSASPMNFTGADFSGLT